MGYGALRRPIEPFDRVPASARSSRNCVHILRKPFWHLPMAVAALMATGMWWKPIGRTRATSGLTSAGSFAGPVSPRGRTCGETADQVAKRNWRTHSRPMWFVRGWEILRAWQLDIICGSRTPTLNKPLVVRPVVRPVVQPGLKWCKTRQDRAGQ